MWFFLKKLNILLIKLIELFPNDFSFIWMIEVNIRKINSIELQTEVLNWGFFIMLRNGFSMFYHNTFVSLNNKELNEILKHEFMLFCYTGFRDLTFVVIILFQKYCLNEKWRSIVSAHYKNRNYVNKHTKYINHIKIINTDKQAGEGEDFTFKCF